MNYDFVEEENFMNVEIVNIKLVGKYNLSRLIPFGYRVVSEDEGAYQFEGVFHRYVFKPIDRKTVEVIIEPKDAIKSFTFQITFGYTNDWLHRCVEEISCGV